MPRRTLVSILAVLLLAMQQEAWCHALTHLGERLTRQHEHVLQLPRAEGPCAFCALFAGGTAAAPNDRALPPERPDADRAVRVEAAVAAIEPPSFYLSRAPPVLL